MADTPDTNEEFFEKAPPEEKTQSSGDHSGKGRQRRDDGDVYPQGRGPHQFGTHGGPDHATSARKEPDEK